MGWEVGNLAIKVEHELHKRRFGRNVGVAAVLVFFIAVVFGLTVVKVTNGDFAASTQTEVQQ